MENLFIRLENKDDYRVVEEVTREAFWNYHSPGCDEHYLVNIMRTSSAFIKELAFVAVYDNKIIGNIMYTKAIVLGDNGEKHSVISFGPISVLPEFQRQGVGRKLIEHTQNLARNLGYFAIIIYGDPEFYKKVGFVQAEVFDIGTSNNTYAVPLLAYELYPGSLSNCKGRFFEDKVFEIDKNCALEFDKLFTPKIKLTGLATQERFQQLVSMHKPRN